MIYHAIHTDPATGKPALDYWAVHAETLTPILVTGSGIPFIDLQIVAPVPGELSDFASHSEVTFDPNAIAGEVFHDIKTQLYPGARFRSRATIARKDIQVPEYLLVFDGVGENPSIFRTTDPHLIIPAKHDDESILDHPKYWRTATDIPVGGWEYWWTDCQIALEELAPAFIATNA